jgi:hypothetical protein
LKFRAVAAKAEAEDGRDGCNEAAGNDTPPEVKFESPRCRGNSGNGGNGSSQGNGGNGGQGRWEITSRPNPGNRCGDVKY